MNSKQKTILIFSAMFFLFMAWFTRYANNQPDTNKPDTEQVNAQQQKRVEEIQKSQDLGNEAKPSVEKPIVHNPTIETDPYEELDALIGLSSVKEEVHSLANFVKLQKQRKEQGLKVPQVTYHCVFTGNPGTGKTTVARILARIYKDLGVLKSGHLVETDQSGLIAEYVGQTAAKTNAVIDSALGGVLFIDEAYALTEHAGSYGGEAISTLLKRMEDDRDNLIVIVAGYTKEMKTFIESNPGLKSRFTRYIDFPDYSAPELHDMFLMRSKKYSYVLDADADNLLLSRLQDIVSRKHNREFGNGRYIRNLFEMSITCQANRLATLEAPTAEQLSQITTDDLIEAFKNVKE